MVPAVILRVTLPPEGDALVVLAHELEGGWDKMGLVGAWGTQKLFFQGAEILQRNSGGVSIHGKVELDRQLGYDGCRKEGQLGNVCRDKHRTLVRLALKRHRWGGQEVARSVEVLARE